MSLSSKQNILQGLTESKLRETLTEQNDENISNKFFISTCIAGLILFGMSDVQSLLRDFPLRWKNITTLKKESSFLYLCIFMYTFLLLTTVYYISLIMWIIIGTMYQIHLTKEWNSITPSIKRPSNCYHYQSFTHFLVGFSVFLLLAYIIGSIYIFFKYRKMSVRSLPNKIEPIELTSIFSTFLLCFPHFILLLLIIALPYQYMRILE